MKKQNKAEMAMPRKPSDFFGVDPGAAIPITFVYKISKKSKFHVS